MKFTLTLLLFLCLPVVSQAKTLTAEPQPVSTISSSNNVDNVPVLAPRLSAKAYLLYDHTSRQILHEHQAHERMEPASLTKLMTAYVTFAALKMNKLALGDKVTPSAQAIRSQPSESRMFLSHSKEVSVADLLRGLIVVSANDAARVLAEKLATNETGFAVLMNREAQKLGLTDTHFVNSTGLPDPLHYSSAYDLALLTSAILNDFPEHFAMYSQREFEYNHIKHYNRNRLLWLDPYVDGMKTGHTESSGYSLVSSATRDKHRLIAVVLGTPSESLRSSESQRLLNYGFQDFEIFYLYKKNEPVSNIRLWKGTENNVKVGLREGLTLTLPKGQRALLKASIETEQPLLAPISNGQQVGLLKLSLDGKPYREYPLLALEPVALVNVFSRGIDSIHMMFIR